MYLYAQINTKKKKIDLEPVWVFLVSSFSSGLLGKSSVCSSAESAADVKIVMDGRVDGIKGVDMVKTERKRLDV
jgi:hypothetical protein